MSTGITAIDNFCGAGGSTEGMKKTGIEVVHASNHWKMAVESHAANHPEVDHSVVDLHLTSPLFFRKTDIAWFSPECTAHSPAGGRKRRGVRGQLHLWEKPKPEDQRSRMTAWNCIEFTEVHDYSYIVVENVIEFTEWSLYPSWLRTFRDLGYRYKEVSFNSQFAGVPQSRDRIYVVFWKEKMPPPNLDFRPVATCISCGPTRGVQSWKKMHTSVGRWNQQYIYRCEQCLNEVIPHRVGAHVAIDFSIPSQRICDRKKPIKETTLKRIEKGLRRFYPNAFVHSNRSTGRATGMDEPCQTVTAQGYTSLIEPPEPPDFILQSNRSLNRATHPGEPPHSVTASGQHWMVEPPSAFLDIARKNSTPGALDEPTATVTAGGFHHALVEPPSAFLAAYHGGRDAVQGVGEPSWTIATNNQQGLVQPPDGFISSYYGNGGESLLKNPSPTIRTTAGHALITDISAVVKECRYRMLEPEEAKILMGFPRNYVLLGNKAQRQKQAGNAVTPPVAEMLGRAIVDALMKA